jgi:glycine cleavage system transcriptional repressor
VFSVAAALADRGVNITDLTTRVAGEDSAPLYVMMLEVALGDVPEEDVRGALEAAGEKAEVEVSLRPLEAEAI